MAKRAFDLVLVAATAPLWGAAVGIVAVLVRVLLGSPVLFRQQRPGLFGRPFELIKFRSMNEARDSSGELLPDDERLTWFGESLRSTSLDELPSLWNVLRGEMTLVGPRPLLMQYLGRYTPRQARRHEVKPGITGWAQVNGRNTMSWDEKLDLDVWYVDHRSAWLDLRILSRTVWQVLSRRGIRHDGSVTMPEFQGDAQAAAGTREGPQ